MPKIFISYRRDDSAFVAQQIHERLCERFGAKSIFIDVDGIPPGADFVVGLHRAIAECDVLLAIIGDRWLDARFADGPRKGQRRLDDPDDLVRAEIASALKLDVPVIPVLVGKVSMTQIVRDLPAGLEGLRTRNPTLVRSGRDLAHDLRMLTRGVKSVLRMPPLTAADLALPPGMVVLPKGLRSFDSCDAGFFTRLLPGPHGNNGPHRDTGLPESLDFWKTRIEQTDAEKTFRIGLIYGPSGCGKSSLVKAGLMPHLAGHVTPVYVEATAGDTETRLSAALQKHCPRLFSQAAGEPSDDRRRAASVATKVVIFLDQFEQWLHSTSDDEQEGLVEMLQKCDGRRLQCVLMVRDDFLTPTSRFLTRLNVLLAADRNCALVDLFDRRHAKKVLALLGQAYGGLPKATVLTPDQDTFLNRAIAGLAEGDRVICVRLALFAQMIKAKEWTPATLKAVGGAEGVGMAFLEDTFDAQTAPPENRRHQAAAQKVLGDLLPEPGATIRGAMRTRQELLSRSGYRRRHADFDELMGLLDNKLRLVTPTGPEGLEPRQGPRAAPEGQYYQLTHDYLVPSLRQWLARRQKETRVGRALLRLGERSDSWNAKPENRHLPAWWELLQILLYTTKSDWTDPQRKMMRKAARFHSVRALSLAVLLIVATTAGVLARNHNLERSRASHASELVRRLMDAKIGQVPAIVEEIEQYRTWADPQLEAEYRSAPDDSPGKLHAGLALLPVDADRADYLLARLLEAGPLELPVIRDALAPHKDALIERLWSAAEQPGEGMEGRRLRAACALATYDPDSPRWEKVKAGVADDLVRAPAVYLAAWAYRLQPVRLRLVEPLAAIYRDARRPESERFLATDILSDYAADQAEMLASLVMVASEQQFAVLFPKLSAHRERGARPLLAAIQASPADHKDESAQLFANAAVALLRMGRPEAVWPLLKHGPDPQVRSYLIDRIRTWGVDVKVLARRLEEESDISTRRALVLMLGQYDVRSFAAARREPLVGQLKTLYGEANDPGLRSAATWTLRQWGEAPWLEQVERDLASDPRRRQQRLERVAEALAKDKNAAGPQWYVTGQGQTMVVIPGPVEFVMGSPPTEEERNEMHEGQHRVRIDRSFAISTTEVTVGQFRRLMPDWRPRSSKLGPDGTPVVEVPWYDAAEYCNRLSEQEGLQDQRCYPTDAPLAGGMNLPKDHLRRLGYRLPTEAEWECACRAGATTARFYGDSPELLAKYAWCRQESPKTPFLPVGSLLPNDFGLFDVLGNADEWCQEAFRAQLAASDAPRIDQPGAEVVLDKVDRVLRGGSSVARRHYLRCANRFLNVPTSPRVQHGFRVARTFEVLE